MMNNYIFQDLVVGNEGLLKGPFGSDLKRSLYVPKSKDTYKVYLQENILSSTLDAGNHYISKEYFETKMFRYAVKENDFIVTCDGTLGEIYQLKGIKEPGLISSSLLRITLNPDLVDYDYFYYLFKALIKKELITQANNSVLKHLPGIEVIRNHPISLPNLDVQKRIGIVLRQIDNKIQNNNKIISELESIAKTLYDYWFLQFEFPNEEGKPYKSSCGKMVYNEVLKRDIPEGWKVVNVKKHCKITWGQCPDGENILPLNTNQDSMLYCSGAGDMRNGLLVDCQARTNASRRIANANDILMSVAGSIGAICFCDKTVSLGRAAVAFSPNRNEELFTLMSVKSFSDRMKTVSNGSIQKVVNDNHLDDMNLVLDDEVLVKFSKYNSLLNEMVKLCRENQELASLRDFLLPMLMNGQVTFK